MAKGSSAVAEKLKIVPLDDRIVVQPEDAEERTSGGIVLPDTAKDKPTRGKVVAVGHGRLLKDGKRAPMSVKTGDTVIYGEYSGSTVRINGEEFKIVRESDLLARVE